MADEAVALRCVVCDGAWMDGKKVESLAGRGVPTTYATLLSEAHAKSKGEVRTVLSSNIKSYKSTWHRQT